MIRLLTVLLTFFLITSNLFAGKYHSTIQYVFPLPNSSKLSDETTIILRFHQQYLDQIDNLQDLIQVNGLVGGACPGTTFFSTDKRTIIFKPDAKFQRDDRVTVKIQTSRFVQDDFEFSFLVESSGANALSKSTSWQPASQIVEPMSANGSTNIRVINGVAVPNDFPEIVTNQTGETAPGKIFYSSRFRETIDSYVIAVHNDGTPYMYNRFDGNGDTANFVRQCNGTFSVFFFGPRHHAILDDGLNIIDTYEGGHGYEPDEHEFLILENGHALMTLEEHITVDMSQYISGGRTNASVHGNMFQEYDKDKNVVFEFRSWDHFTFDDPYGVNLRGSDIDYIHMNAVSLDYDGHYLLSSKHLSEMTKINRDTGEIIWRFGGKNNQFEFINDNLMFSYQHNVRAVPDKPGYYTLFDNGNMRSPNYSRAVEYKLDTANMTTEKVWQYRFTPDRESYWMGSVQRLPNGNTFIDCSTTSPAMSMEVTADGQKLFQLLSYGSSSYRSFRYDLDVDCKAPFFMIENFGYILNLIFNKFGDENVAWYKIYHRLTSETGFTVLDSTQNTWYQAIGLENKKFHVFKISAVGHDGAESDFSREITARVYYTEPGTNLIKNGEFTSTNYWQLLEENGSNATGRLSDDGYLIDVVEGGQSLSDIKLVQQNIQLVQGQEYTLQFDAFGESVRYISAELKSDDDWNATNYSKQGNLPLYQQKRHYSYTFTMEDLYDERAQLVFECGRYDTDVTIDNVSLEMFDPTTVNEPPEFSPESFRLEQNYPNPFNPETTIQYTLTHASHVRLTIFNVRGEKVRSLVNRPENSGTYEIIWDATDENNCPVSSGIYFYKLISNDYVEQRKMVLLR